MRAFNHNLTEKLLEADGRYLDTQALSLLEQYVQSYSTRLETYEQLRDRNKHLVGYALNKFSQAQPLVMQRYASRCQYDMSEVLRYIALAVLKDDQIFFKDHIAAWLSSVLLAHKTQSSCAIAYRYLLEATGLALPPQSTQLVRPYLEDLLIALQP